MVKAPSQTVPDLFTLIQLKRGEDLAFVQHPRDRRHAALHLEGCRAVPVNLTPAHLEAAVASLPLSGPGLVLTTQIPGQGRDWCALNTERLFSLNH